MDIWQELGLEATTDQRAVKRAYAQRLKEVHPEDDPDGFQRLRTAYETALNYASDMVVYDESRSTADMTSEGEAYDPAAFDVDRQAEQFSEIEATDPCGDWLRQALREGALRLAKSDTPKLDSEQLQRHAKLLVHHLMKTLEESGEDAAIKRFVRLSDRSHLQNLELRDYFEEQLMFNLCECKVVPTQLVGAVAEAFEWQDGGSYLEDRHPQAFRYLAARYRAQCRYAELVVQARGGWSTNRITGADGNTRAAFALTSTYRPWRFRWLSLNTSNLRAVRKLLGDLQEQHPETIHFHLDPKTIAWWQQALSVPRIGLREFFWTLLIAASLWVIAVDTGQFGLNTSASPWKHSAFYGATSAVLFLSWWALAYLTLAWNMRWRSGSVSYLAHAFIRIEQAIGRKLPKPISSQMRVRHIFWLTVFSLLLWPILAIIGEGMAGTDRLPTMSYVGLYVLSATLSVASYVAGLYLMQFWHTRYQPVWQSVRQAWWFRYGWIFIGTANVIAVYSTHSPSSTLTASWIGIFTLCLLWAFLATDMIRSISKLALLLYGSVICFWILEDLQPQVNGLDEKLLFLISMMCILVASQIIHSAYTTFARRKEEFPID